LWPLQTQISIKNQPNDGPGDWGINGLVDWWKRQHVGTYLGQSRDLWEQLKKALAKTGCQGHSIQMNELLNLSTVQLRRIADIKERIDSLQYELSRVLGDGGKTSVKVPGKRIIRMSTAGRARIAAAQRARWAKYNAAKGVPAAKSSKSSRSRRTLSSAAKAKIAAAARARWAKAKAAGKSRL
jgi:hypothetical protein